MTTTITTYTLADCPVCGRQPMARPDGILYPHKDLTDWPTDKGTLYAPDCTGTQGTVSVTGTQTYDETTGHWRTVEVLS